MHSISEKIGFTWFDSYFYSLEPEPLSLEDSFKILAPNHSYLSSQGRPECSQSEIMEVEALLDIIVVSHKAGFSFIIEFSNY